MKNLFLIAVLVISVLFVSCNNSGKPASEPGDAVKSESLSDLPVYNLDDLLKVADQNVDKKVKVIGYITHTCKHSGKRCFIVGDSQKTSMRVEAKGNIGGFNRELTGSKVEIAGTLKERRLSKEYLEQAEKEVNEKAAKEDGSAESCEAELNNIAEMRQWMADNNKEYYSIYFMNGEEYEVVD